LSWSTAYLLCSKRRWEMPSLRAMCCRRWMTWGPGAMLIWMIFALPFTVRPQNPLSLSLSLSLSLHWRSLPLIITRSAELDPEDICFWGHEFVSS
jgi:hypothetical protein